MRACARKARKNKPALAVSAVINQMIMIERPKRVKPLDLGLCALLPIEPPKINAIIFITVMKEFEIAFNKFRVGYIKGDFLFALFVFCDILKLDF